MSSDTQNVLINGEWKASRSPDSFQPVSPLDGKPIGEKYPVSDWAEIEEALAAGNKAARELDRLEVDKIAVFLNRFADNIENRKDEIVAMANRETALPSAPRLADVELPRTTGQLRQAAAAVAERSWTLPVIDTANGIRSVCTSLRGVIWVFGPNNFPLAFNSVSGGDFAAAIASGNAVIAKGNASHPGTTRILAEEAHKALKEAGLPKALVQLIYRTPHDVGARMVAHRHSAALAYTGSRDAGLMLKEASDKAGKPAYLELSSINPVVLLPKVLEAKAKELAEEFSGSCLLGAGQFCTSPGLVLGMSDSNLDHFKEEVKTRFSAAAGGKLLGRGVQAGLHANIQKLIELGAVLITGGSTCETEGFCHENTWLSISGEAFLKNPEGFQLEAFGNASLLVEAESLSRLVAIIETLEGNLTGSIYSDPEGADDGAYNQIAPALRLKVGRLLNDKMPTGVAVSPAMNHGGPYPATGHPGFTAVGIPASLRRFTMLSCYDNVRDGRLPPELQDGNPLGIWRCVNGGYTKEPLSTLTAPRSIR